ncbi:hypothetical protein KGF56_004644 [Candida oxycetoniae]|uniref:Regulator of phospholipase D SRF1 n=1 Tax=Candida oxycetoniae TaxID=497107 RepID=A0AAI9ST23_9ASCO|nr:uncharacterized protein KGF56_004644 [Candida oxycetoniae]KAI3402552.2 hypothetical protein KGF56_004644 [Candida oxycetoniae]
MPDLDPSLSIQDSNARTSEAEVASAGETASGAAAAANAAATDSTIKVSTYSRVTTIPPYVLDSISKFYTHGGIHGDLSATFKASDDPYIKAIDGSWYQFKESVKHPTTYPGNKVGVDKEYLDTYDLESPWGGDERLKKEFNDYKEADNLSKGAGIFGYFRRKEKGENDTRVISTAGYWMGQNRSQLKPRLKKVFLFDPLVPLMLRIITLIFCVAALALACSIFIFSKHEYDGHPVEQQASTIMAIVVQTCALVYVIYIAYDEYAGKPLGLRKPMGKMRLVMLDLLFIIFSSANLSLAFNTLYDDEWVCQIYRKPGLVSYDGIFPIVSSICRRQKALASFLFVVLVTWVLTFTISLIRVIDKVNTPN